MMIIKILFFVPIMLWRLITLPFYFNKKSYKPSSANEREMSQYVRNKFRLLTYKAKIIINPIKEK